MDDRTTANPMWISGITMNEKIYIINNSLGGEPDIIIIKGRMIIINSTPATAAVT